VPSSPDGVLTAVFDPAWASVRLTVDGAQWPSGARENLASNPHAASTTSWGVQLGTGEGMSSWAIDTTPGAGPEGRTGFLRRTVTTAKTGGNSGIYYREAAAPLSGVAGDVRVLSTWVMFSHAATVSLQGTLRLGSTSVTTATAPAVVVPANTWTRLSVVVTATGTYDGAQAWAVVSATSVIPVGGWYAGVDVLIEAGALLRHWFDGSHPTGLSPLEVVAWTGAANASTSTSTVPAVDAVTISRQVPGGAAIAVRGAEALPAIGGYFTGSDPEAPLETTVNYRVEGYASGALVTAASVIVDTTSAARGLWITVPGKPDLSVCVRFRAMGEVVSRTIGGVYQVAGGGSIAQTTAQWSGLESDTTTIELSPLVGEQTARLRAAPDAGRVLLLRPVGSTDLDPGWYFVSTATRLNPAGIESYARRWFALQLQRTGIPAGSGQGIPGVTYAALAEAFEDYQALTDSGLSYFDVAQGAWS